MLRVLTDYGDFDEESGKLRSFEINIDCDTEWQKIVKKAKLRRVEVVVIILYTGPMFVVSCLPASFPPPRPSPTNELLLIDARIMCVRVLLCSSTTGSCATLAHAARCPQTWSLEALNFGSS